MDDQLTKLEQSVEGLQKGMADFRQDVVSKIDQSFRWSVITMAIGLIITWFGIFLIIARGGNILRRSLLG